MRSTRVDAAAKATGPKNPTDAMLPLPKRIYRLAASLLLIHLLTACGGGGSNASAGSSEAASAQATATALQVVSTQRILSAPLNSEGTVPTLHVRASGVIAADVGPVMRVLVDGAEIGTAEIRATDPIEYSFAAPALRPGSKVDVVYTNDATVGGVDRNLVITQVRSGNTYILPTTPGVTVDWGKDAAAFDGINTVAGQTRLWSNGALRMTWPEPNMTDRLTVRASGVLVNNTGPQMLVRVDGIVVGSTEVRSSQLADHSFTVPPLKPGSKVEIAYLNQGTAGDAERLLDVAYVMSGTTVQRANAAGVVFDRGQGSAAFDGIDVIAGAVRMPDFGALRVRWPSPNMTDTLTVRASSKPGTSTAPIMEVQVDGIAVGAVAVNSATPGDYQLPSLPLKPGARIDVSLVNSETSGASPNSLSVFYAISGRTYLRGTPGEASLHGTWPEANLTDTLTVRAQGAAAGSVSPLMQVLVDGILVGSREVKTNTLTDFSFAVPPMQAGMPVQVVQSSSLPQGSGLQVDYLISGSTYVRPNATGLTTIPTHLDIAWPAPNITQTVTVYASGTTAGGVAPRLQVWIDGVATSSVEVRSTTLAAYTLAVPALKPGSKIELLLANPGTVDGVQRAVNVGYVINGTTVLRNNATSLVSTEQGLRASWPEQNLTARLTVRAHGTLAGGTGPVVQLRVDGVVTGTAEIRSTEPADYEFAVPPLQAGNKVDLVFTNSATVDGARRTLTVGYLISEATYVRPNGDTATFDRGVGEAAFDGGDIFTGLNTVSSSGAMRMTWPAPNLTSSLTVRASATLLDDKGPSFELRVDDVIVRRVEVRSAEPADYEIPVPALKPGSRVDVVYTNEGGSPGNARALAVAYLKSDKTVLLPTAPGVNLDFGSGLAAFDGVDVQPGQTSLTRNGALRGVWPAQNMTDTLTVRASGVLAAKVGPLMQVRVDGVVLGTQEIRNASPADFNFPSLPLSPGSRVDVVMTNAETVNGQQRQLSVNYLLAGRTSLLPTAAGVQFDAGTGASAFDGQQVSAGRSALNINGALRATWPAANLTDNLTVRARGAVAGGVGPKMQVHVDGIVVGNVEVKSSDFADYTFPAPPMTPGRRVDVVYNNDGSVGGVDRNLYVNYLITGNTYILPTATGVTYDRGAGDAAFDGADVITGRYSMSWNGALRLVWPEPNITDSVTIRASGTLAGNVGPLMQLRVNGVIVSSVEVRSTTPADYVMPTPPLRSGSAVDLIYANDAVVDGVDRDLRVAYAMAGKTVVVPGVSTMRYDLGSGSAAYDNVDVVTSQSLMGQNGALRFAWPAPNMTQTIIVRASGTSAGNVAPQIQVRVDGIVVATLDIRSSTSTDYSIAVPTLKSGSKIDIVFVNQGTVSGQARTVTVQYVKAGGATLVPTAPTTQIDRGTGEAAFDGLETVITGSGTLASNAALRFTVPQLPVAGSDLSALYAASRFLQQASFGPSYADVQKLSGQSFDSWVTSQMAIPPTNDYVNYVQGFYDQGDNYRPKGSLYTANWVGQRFWATAAVGDDQLRKRVAFALHQIFMISQEDPDLHGHVRAYAAYLDILNRHAFGNFRNLLQDIALSPAMGIYLSHMRNRKEDPATGRVPDENFAREIMQLFTIGLHELNADGTPKLDASGNPIETYTNDDVMALAKVFTGWSWAFPDNQLTETKFRWSSPDYRTGYDERIDLLPMKAYPGLHSTSEKRLFSGRANAVVIPANTSAQESLRIALDTLFQHPNVGPFIGRSLIQRLTTSHPSAGYVARVAAKFNNNGLGVRGDLGAVVRAVLLDTEARNPPAGSIGKLREPVLRVAHWVRSLEATSVTGHYMMASELDPQAQQVMHAPTVFGYFRPGFVPPNTVFSANNITVPEMQIVNETTTAHWVNLAMGMVGNGLGWTGTARDVSTTLTPLVTLSTQGQVDALIERLNLLLYGGRMSATLKSDILNAVTGVAGATPSSHLNRARLALFMALSSPEYLVQH